ncbi:tryptophan RNA-binding attenuator protein-like domain-containing protein [Aspergillus leporis]|uniref:Altered inheritance of mitochondria protein 24, mitochondrial n=1 Tax=Aspergillus leporis TaxID=41062 RepID=A0A5N5WYU7_9EURO|nr:tryptophan RNA-binding attenuator protein-like domain-containing protein [Aspergillus leporis]
MATTYFPPPPQDTQFPPPQRSATTSQSLSDFSAPNFSFPPPQRQQTAPAVNPYTAEANTAAFTANGDLNNPHSVSPPPQSSTPPSLPVHSQFPQVVSTTSQDEVGTFNGGSYRISHRDTNSVLTMQLAMGCPIEAKPGAMVAMSGDISLRGTVKFGLAKMVAGGMTSSIYTGPGEILLAPPFLGDITVLRLDGSERWKVGKDAFLAKTSGVEKDYKAQGMTKAVFSGEGFIIYHMSGIGLVWLQSFGAIIRKDIPEGKTYLVDNGYIVAWNCKYKIERAASGGLLSAFSSSEGLACKFEGPGTVYLQTRNTAAFAAHLSGK